MYYFSYNDYMDYTNNKKVENIKKINYLEEEKENYVRIDEVLEKEQITKWLSRLDLSTPEINNYFNGKLTNWQDLMLNNAVQQNYNVSISKKGEDYQYYWSIGYMDNEGIKDGDAFLHYENRRINPTTLPRITGFVA